MRHLVLPLLRFEQRATVGNHVEVAELFYDSDDIEISIDASHADVV